MTPLVTRTPTIALAYCLLSRTGIYPMYDGSHLLLISILPRYGISGCIMEILPQRLQLPLY
eukprot:NODE_6752_length_345_cov_14.699324_g6025_i0.p2 GENE.NODE_6752_length_345_cov_14.699324_g6025_i0~~NODE_6752_length_345_cov_14.699324_g6025_i0.p2  ORF type:complete len:61 (+),score=2.48 NODE_6752_length_345_cov_14.699324_g6025_i0:47-229(+)